MKSIGVRELRQNASRYLKLVESGESVEVTDRGRPVARLVPVPTSRFDQLVAEGRIRRATGSLRDLPPPLPLPPGAEPPSSFISRMRDE
ncbi:MAG: type II toxin-antitoxin system prevent-host-death family antitoxin [Chloroflexota bacterium]